MNADNSALHHDEKNNLRVFHADWAAEEIADQAAESADFMVFTALVNANDSALHHDEKNNLSVFHADSAVDLIAVHAADSPDLMVVTALVNTEEIADQAELKNPLMAFHADWTVLLIVFHVVARKFLRVFHTWVAVDMRPVHMLSQMWETCEATKPGRLVNQCAIFDACFANQSYTSSKM